MTIDRKPGSGRKQGPHDIGKAKKIECILKRAPNTSGKKASRVAQCSDYLVRKVKANAGLKTYKVQKIPDRNAVKNLDVKSRARKLKSNFMQKYSCCIIDDETYVLADFKQLPVQKFYVADARGNVEAQFRAQKQTKFPKKNSGLASYMQLRQKKQVICYSGLYKYRNIYQRMFEQKTSSFHKRAQRSHLLMARFGIMSLQ